MTQPGAHPVADASARERVVYDDAIVRKFVLATMGWGIVGMLVGVILAIQLVLPEANIGPYLTFGRLRPLHTNAVIFAFAGNAIFAAIYYSTQRLVKVRMASDLLSKIHFWGWQAIILSAAITLPLGFTQTKEYAELEWPIDLAITLVWVLFAVNFFWTLIIRRVQHMYVAIWFYIASIVTVAILHIFNNIVVPVSMFKGYSAYAGVHDALVQWWYGHNAVAFFLTTPFLGMMYYFLPKAANRPVFSYKLSIIHFWSLIFIYIWAGPHHLHYTALPEWASTLGMVFSIMLWMPSWGGMINGLFTLRGAWDRLRDDPILKFFVVAITFYGMATFEGPMLSVKAVNSLSHYTDWTIGHVHSGALGWNGFMTFGMIYWLVPRLWQTQLYSKKLANAHFWLGTVGIVLYVVALWTAGITQGLMWRAFDETGRLQYPQFIETVTVILPMYWVRLIGGSMFLVGVLLSAYNMWRTIQTAPKSLPDPEALVDTPLWRQERAARGESKNYDDMLFNLTDRARGGWHRILEGWPMTFTVLTIGAVAIGGLAEIVPLMLIKTNVPTISTVKPYTPLELEGRDIYIREGCVNCHSQMVRPLKHEIERYGKEYGGYSKPGEGVYDRPHLWGSKRTGPDLAREHGKRSNLWHVQHMEAPRSVVEQSIMPAYPHLLTDKLDLSDLQKKVDVMAMLGVPYSQDALKRAPELAQEQALELATAIAAEGGPADLQDREIVALVAYLQRLGRDIKDVSEDEHQQLINHKQILSQHTPSDRPHQEVQP